MPFVCFHVVIPWQTLLSQGTVAQYYFVPFWTMQKRSLLLTVGKPPCEVLWYTQSHASFHPSQSWQEPSRIIRILSVASLHWVQLNWIGEGLFWQTTVMKWTDPGQSWPPIADPSECHQRKVHVCVESPSMSHVSEITCSALLHQLAGRRAQSVILIASSIALRDTAHVRSTGRKTAGEMFAPQAAWQKGQVS